MLLDVCVHKDLSFSEIGKRLRFADSCFCHVLLKAQPPSVAMVRSRSSFIHIVLLHDDVFFITKSHPKCRRFSLISIFRCICPSLSFGGERGNFFPPSRDLKGTKLKTRSSVVFACYLYTRQSGRQENLFTRIK